MPQVSDRLSAALADRYLIKEEIGRGGMATVYRAEDLKHRRDVAIKVLHPELATGQVVPERFLREIRIAAGLTHPQILPVHDSGNRNEFLYYVMPFVGETLRDRLEREKQLSIDAALTITRAVASALDYAHRQDVIHRDIKPENILFSEGQPVVADFGIATAVSASGSENITAQGMAVGTPMYMSPEQASADQELDRRTDLYALACVLYEMLAGEPPFQGKSAQATMLKHLGEPAPRVRTRRANVPSGVERAISKALAKEPADRFATTVAFADALAAPASGAFPAAFVTEERRMIAVLPFVNASPDPDNEYFSDGMTDELINALANVAGLHVASRTSVFALKGTRQDIRSIGAHLNVSAVLEGTVRKAGDQLRITAQLTNVADGHTLWSERYDRTIEDVFAIQDEIAQTIVRTLRATLLRELGDTVPQRYTENVAAYNHYLKGRFYWNQRTPAGTAEAIKHFEQAIAADPEYALAYSGLSDVHSLEFDFRGVPVEEGMRRAKEEACKALELDDSLAEAHTSLAWLTFIHDWDWDVADQEFRRALQLNPRYATAHQWYAWLHMAMGRIDESLAHGQAALELDPASVSIRRTTGWLHIYARQADPAVEHLRRAVEMDPTAPESHRVLGLALMQGKDYQEAQSALLESISLSTEHASATAALGYVAALQGKKEEALAALDELNARLEEAYVSPVAMVIIHVGLGNADQAFKYLETVHEERRGWMAYLRVEPLLDPLRSDDRFDALVKRMSLI